MDNQKLRQAIAHAIDVPSIIQYIMLGSGEVTAMLAGTPRGVTTPPMSLPISLPKTGTWFATRRLPDLPCTP